jgi:hypothetical protein
MLKVVLISLLPVALFLGERSAVTAISATAQSETTTVEKLVAASGTISVVLDAEKINGSGEAANGGHIELNFDFDRNSFFTAIATNGDFRGLQASSLGIVPRTSAYIPAKLAESYNRLILEQLPWGAHYSLVVRDRENGFTFFYVEGHQFEFDAATRTLRIIGGRLLLSDEFSELLGKESRPDAYVGELSATGSMLAIEVQKTVNGEIASTVLPAGAGMSPDAGTVPGPDVIVGDVNGLGQFGGATGTQVGLALGTDSCNAGTVDLNWFALPSNDHPVIPQNLYRMSGGADNTERFEQIGQSSVKHGFEALRENICGFGCNGVGGTRLGSGCSDPYVASLNAGPSLGSRAWINPFTGFFPRSDSGQHPNSHTGHVGDTAAGHKIRTEIADLNTSLNAGATYYAEGQYVTPHEYAWCQANPTQCNMNNNVSYRRYNVFGTGSPFAFSPAGETVRMQAAIRAWTGATFQTIQPEPIADGIGIVASKVTNPSPGVWRYEYAVYNQNLDRAIQSFSIPIGSGVTLTNTGFHAPPQHPGSAFDGTLNNTGFSNAAWAPVVVTDSVTWSSETLAQNPNANAIRWGTLYNFRFDANVPPMTGLATVGFFKTGAPLQVSTNVPTPASSTVTISGVVTSPANIALRNVVVTLTDSNGVKRTATTSSFGTYSFINVEPGSTYTVSAASKRYRFAAQVLNVTGNLNDINLVGLE